MMMMMLLSLLRCLEIQAGRGEKTCLYEEEKQLRGELIRILGEKAARKAGA